LVLASVRIRSWAKKKKGYVLPLFGVAQQPACGAGVGVHVSHAVCVGSNPIVGKKEKRLCFASLRVGIGSGFTFLGMCFASLAKVSKK
jgi:hypothetical protein